jgi:hypothetical protein
VYTQVYTTVFKVVHEVKTKIHKVGPRHTIYLKKELIDDSGFPFKIDEPIKVKIVGETLVIEKDS